MNIRLTTILLSSLSVAALFSASLANVQSRAAEDFPKVADWSGGYFSSFYLIADAPRNLQEFDVISIEFIPNQDNDEGLRPDSRGNIQTLGKLTTKNGTVYRFAEAHLTEGGAEIRLHCVTKTIDGVRYSFDGKFPTRGREVRKGGAIIGYVRLDGTLTKFARGRKIVVARIELTPNGIE